MKILYLIPGRGIPPEELERRQFSLQQYVSAGTEIVVKEVGKGPVTMESVMEENLAINPMLEYLLQYRKIQFFDAVIIGCAGDPGVRAARELLDVPVIGPAQAAYHFSGLIADNFSVLTTKEYGGEYPDSIYIKLREIGLEGRIKSVEYVDCEIDSMWSSQKSKIVEDLSLACKSAVSRGAGCVIPLCMSLSFALAELKDKWTTIPVVDPLPISIRAAETMIQYKLTQSRVTYPLVPTNLLKNIFQL